MRALVLLLALSANAAPGAKPADLDRQLSLPEYRKGLAELRGYFVKRNEDPAVADLYIKDLETAFPVQLGERVPVTKGVFDLFLKYQAAWTRKTRDSKNQKVGEDQLGHEMARARELKEAFRSEAMMKSPRFYGAFQAAVRDVRALRRRGNQDYAGTSNVFFSDQIDDSYSHVDTGNEALEKGDQDKAISEANLALQINPANADAMVLRAGAEYDRGNAQGAVSDAQAALLLDPSNQQAQAILSLTGTDNGAAAAALRNAAAGSGDMDAAGRATLPRVADEPGGVSAQASGPASRKLSLGLLPAGAPSATPAVGKILAVDLTIRAASLATSDPHASLTQFGQAVALDPGNSQARGWYATVANRAGDYSAARGAAEAELASDPGDALAYFNKAYALAGAGDKDGMLEALTQAAKIDPIYKPALDQAQAMSDKEALEILFGSPSNQHEPPAPLPRRHHFPWLHFFAGIGGAFLVTAAVFYGTSRTARPRVRRA